MPTAPASPLVAVDANVVMDLGKESESVLDALATIRQRLRSVRIILPPTAKLELMHIARHGDTANERDLALSGIAAARRWRIVPVNLMPVGHGIVERVAEKLRCEELLPASEVNDSELVTCTIGIDKISADRVFQHPFNHFLWHVLYRGTLLIINSVWIIRSRSLVQKKRLHEKRCNAFRPPSDE